MALLGAPLLVCVIALALAMPVAVLVAWPRVHGTRVARTAQRLGLVVVAQLTAVFVGLVALNDYGQFFTSWSDVFGTAPAAHAVIQQHFHGIDFPGACGDHQRRVAGFRELSVRICSTPHECLHQLRITPQHSGM